MKNKKSLYHGYRFPQEIISHTVWLYHRFCLSLRDVEELLAERGIIVTYESIRQWCNHFGPEYTRDLKKRSGCLGDDWYLLGRHVIRATHYREFRSEAFSKWQQVTCA